MHFYLFQYWLRHQNLVDKKLYFIYGAIIVFIIIISQLPSQEKVVSKSKIMNKENIDVGSKLERKISKNNAITKDESNEIRKITVEEDYQLIYDCGFSWDTFLNSFNHINLENISDKEKQKIDNTIEECEKWFDEIKVLSQAEIRQLKREYKRKKELLTNFISFKYDKNIVSSARQGIYGLDYEIKLMALVYLLRYDFSFVKEVAANMGVADISYLVSGSNIYLETLYICQHGKDCSANSSLMEQYCEGVNDKCNLSFPTWLRSKEVTFNLYDDMMRAIVAIDKVLDSDWFLDHPLDI